MPNTQFNAQTTISALRGIRRTMLKTLSDSMLERAALGYTEEVVSLVENNWTRNPCYRLLHACTNVPKKTNKVTIHTYQPSTEAVELSKISYDQLTNDQKTVLRNERQNRRVWSANNTAYRKNRDALNTYKANVGAAKSQIRNILTKDTTNIVGNSCYQALAAMEVLHRPGRTRGAALMAASIVFEHASRATAAASCCDFELALITAISEQIANLSVQVESQKTIDTIQAQMEAEAATTVVRDLTTAGH